MHPLSLWDHRPTADMYSIAINSHLLRWRAALLKPLQAVKDLFILSRVYLETRCSISFLVHVINWHLQTKPHDLKQKNFTYLNILDLWFMMIYYNLNYLMRCKFGRNLVKTLKKEFKILKMIIEFSLINKI